MQEFNIIEDSVGIFLCTYNGEFFLKKQLESLERQTFKNWRLIVSDDGSTDKTKEILEEFKIKVGEDKVLIFEGPQLGFSKNFLSILLKADDVFNYYAWADQDDIWFEDKLEIAIKCLKEDDSNTPKIYCGRTILIDQDGKKIGESPLFDKKPSFSNALVQSIAGGNTMVFNKKSYEFLKSTCDVVDIVSHDWWAYILISGCGGKIIYDRSAKVYYRQHNNNIIGSNIGFSARILRCCKLLNGSFKRWNEINIEALGKVENILTEENANKIEYFKSAKEAKGILKLKKYKKSGIYRQTFMGNIALIISILLNKI